MCDPLKFVFQCNMSEVASTFRVAIPSYQRADILCSRTLPLLMSWKFPAERVHVFCIKEEEAVYRDALTNMLPWAQSVQVITGPLGLHHMRNHIQDFFGYGVPVLHMDDDLQDILVMQEDTHENNVKKSTRYPLVPLATVCDPVEWIQNCFVLAQSKGARMWGIYPVKNGYFMKDLPEVSTDLRFCVGTFWGIWNDPQMRALHLEEKEDFERTLIAYELDRCIVRFNRVCAKTQYYKTRGGMQARGTNRLAESRTSCDYLLRTWPQYCRIYTGKKTGICEVRLRDAS